VEEVTVDADTLGSARHDRSYFSASIGLAFSAFQSTEMTVAVMIINSMKAGMAKFHH
jgi:hypothetical protein